MPSIYQVPILLEEQGLVPQLIDILNLANTTPPMDSTMWQQWRKLTLGNSRFYDPVTIALVGKYIELHDAYTSVIKSLEHCAMRCRRQLNLVWVDAEHLEPHMRDSDGTRFHKAWHDICTADGILVPGGFGKRGTEGMIAAAKYARENKKPYLGICLGMQIAVIEYARHVCGVSAATSEEFDGGAGDKVVLYMPELDKKTMGATMRLGLRPTHFQPGSEWSKLRALYGSQDVILERHRHRYEVNPEYIVKLEEGGLSFVGKDDAGVRMEIAEIKGHPWFVGVQFHPEYLSRVLKPSKPYLGFLAASAGCLEETTRDVKGKPLGMGEEVNGVDGVNGHF